MTHPLEQLAPYVDGSLTEPERVWRSNATWPRAPSAAREVAAASEARAALRSMPEVEVPTDLGVRRPRGDGGASRHTTRVPALGAGRALRWPPPPSWRSLAITLPRLGGGDRRRQRRRTMAAARGPRRPATCGWRSTPPTSTPPRSQAEAQASAARYAADADRRSQEAPPRHLPGRRDEGPAGAARSAEALRCLRTAFHGLPGRPRSPASRHRSRAPRPTWRSCWSARSRSAPRHSDGLGGCARGLLDPVPDLRQALSRALEDGAQEQPGNGRAF